MTAAPYKRGLTLRIYIHMHASKCNKKRDDLKIYRYCTHLNFERRKEIPMVVKTLRIDGIKMTKIKRPWHVICNTF